MIGKPTHIKQLGSYFVANNITTAAKNRAILLSSCGTATYKIIWSVVVPTKLTEVDYQELVQKVKEHYLLKLSEIVQCFKFHTWNRQLGESIAVYVARL